MPFRSVLLPRSAPMYARTAVLAACCIGSINIAGE
nr:MAG TPA: hypothetical protein [Caudoviricetes sp.]